MHTHLTSSPLFAGYNSLLFTDSFWAVISTNHARLTLEAGFTTVRNVGSKDYDDVGLRQAVENGFVPGADRDRDLCDRLDRRALRLHVLPAQDGAEEPGRDRQSGGRTADGPPAPQVRRPADQDLRDRRRVLAWDTPGAQQLTIDEIKAIVEEAHMTGLKVAAHAHARRGSGRDPGGVDTIEHASLVDDEGIRLAVQKGVYFGWIFYQHRLHAAEGKKNGVLEENLRRTATSR